MVHMIIDSRFLTVIFQHRIFRACVLNHLIKDRKENVQDDFSLVYQGLTDFNSKQQGRKAYSRKEDKETQAFLSDESETKH